jgi:hypothetical protein
MGFRFYRRIRLLPGVRLNVSKSGVSTSIGGRGAWLTFGKRGTRATVGLPGTGLSYTEAAKPGAKRSGVGWLLLVLLAIVALVWHAARM